MRRLLALIAVVAVPSFGQETAPEVQLALTSLRAGERARLEAALGRADSLPLYRADLEFDPATRLVKGLFALTLTPKTKVTELKLRLAPNAAHPGAVTLKSPKVDGKPVEADWPEPSLYRVKLTGPLEAGAALQLELTLSAVVPKAPEGSDRLMVSPESLDSRGGDYGAFSVSPEVSCLAGVLPMLVPSINGRAAAGASGIGDLGTFEPSNFVVSVKVPVGHTVISPGAQLGELPDGKGRVRFAYAVAAAREFPILVLKGVEVASAKAGDVTVESYFTPADRASGKSVLEHAVRSLVELEKRLGPYPYQRFRVVEARLASGAGGMEFPGLITVSTALYRGTADPLSVLGLSGAPGSELIQGLFLAMLEPMLANMLEFTVAHEVTHQYFAMLVGNDPIDEPIVDEPLTQHGALLVFEWRRGKKLADEVREGQLRLAYQVHRLNGGVDGKANRPTRDYQSNGEYAALMYGKAPLFYDEVRKELGDEAWLKALRTYVDENRYRWAGPKTLLQVVARQHPGKAAKVEELRRRWWEEKHGDEDIGVLDLDRLLAGGAGGGSLKGALDPEVLEQVRKAMEALSGQ